MSQNDVIALDSTPPSTPKKPTAAEKLAAKREARIKAAFSVHDNTGAGRISRVALLASPSYLSDMTYNSVLREVRVLYRERLKAHQHKISNLLFWHLDGKPTGVAVLIFTAEHFLDHIKQSTLDGCAQFALSQMPGCSIIFAISAIDRVLETTNRAYVRQRKPGMVFSRTALQDCYTHLDVEYGIRVHVSTSHSELAHTIRDWTDAVAKMPCHKEEEFVEATVQYRRSRRKGTAGAVIAFGGPSLVQEGSDDDIDVSQPFGPHLRAEGSGDTSYWYMSFLRMIPSVSVDKAKAIRLWFPSFEILMEGYRRCKDEKAREMMLADIRFNANQTRIGPNLSRRIYAILHGVDGSAAVPT